MADSSLTVTGGTGTQAPATNNNLQANGQNNLSNGLSGKVQPGVTADQLRSDQGISLSPTSLPTILLGANTNTVPITAPPATHHFNPLLMIFSIALFVIAIVMFKITKDSSKKHNQY